MPTQTEISNHLDMSERNAREMLKSLNIDWRETSLDEIRETYIRDMREKAAGRGGDSAGELTRARIEESKMKTAKMKIEHLREIGELIFVEDAADVIVDWCRQANLDYLQGFNKLVSEIQSKYNIEIDNGLVEDIVCTTTSRIKAHAEKLGARLIEGGEDISQAES